MGDASESANPPTGRGASAPVIGVILMLTITVILGGLIGTFILDLGHPGEEKAPDAQFTVNYSDSGDGYANHNDWINVTHDGGDAIDSDRLKVVVAGTDVSGTEEYWSGRVTRGDTLPITDSSSPTHATIPDIRDGDRVQVIWENPRSDRAVVLTDTEISRTE